MRNNNLKFNVINLNLFKNIGCNSIRMLNNIKRRMHTVFLEKVHNFLLLDNTTYVQMNESMNNGRINPKQN